MSRRLIMAVKSGGALDAGLVFHAPLTVDLADRISGRTLTVAHGTVVPAPGGAVFTGGRLKLTDPVLPLGSDPCTLAIRVASSAWGVGGAGTGYCDFYGYGQNSTGQARLIAANTGQLCGHLYARDYDASFVWDMTGETWVHCAVVVDETGVAVYANGALLGTAGIAPETEPGELTIGGCFYDLSNAYLTGKAKDARIYNRALSTEEVAALAALEV